MELTWQYQSQDRTVVTLPFCISETDRLFNISLTSDTNISNAFFYTDGDYSGLVSAKRSEQSSYMLIEAYSPTPSCYIGRIGQDETVTINLKVNFSSGYSGEYMIPVYLGYGVNIEPESFQDENMFWKDNTTDDPFFWCSSSEEADEYIWAGGTS